MKDADPALSLRIVNCDRVSGVGTLGEFHDLGGALVLVSDLAFTPFNRVEAFTTDDRHIEMLLDLGFSLLRAFDRPPTVYLTPFDRPRSIERRLRSRGLAVWERTVAMTFRGDAGAIETEPDVRVQQIEPEEAMLFADVRYRASGFEPWMRRFFAQSIVRRVLEPDHAYYLAYAGGEPAGTAICTRDAGVAMIGGLATLKAFRKRGVATALLARAIRDAQDGGCDVVALGSGVDGMGRALYERLGFVPLHETALWTVPGRG